MAGGQFLSKRDPLAVLHRDQRPWNMVLKSKISHEPLRFFRRADTPSEISSTKSSRVKPMRIRESCRFLSRLDSGVLTQCCVQEEMLRGHPFNVAPNRIQRLLDRLRAQGSSAMPHAIAFWIRYRTDSSVGRSVIDPMPSHVSRTSAAVKPRQFRRFMQPSASVNSRMEQMLPLIACGHLRERAQDAETNEVRTAAGASEVRRN